MPKPATYPILYNDLKTIEISNLKKWGYLKAGIQQTGIIKWSINEKITGRVSIEVKMNQNIPFLQLEYTANEKEIKYQVLLTSLVSNLKKGLIWYFICPKTGKRCRKLHLMDGYFLHRTAFTGAMYEKQTYSQKVRDMMAMYEYVLGPDRPSELARRKHFKKYYNGKLTKRYMKAENKIQKGLELARFKGLLR